MKIQPYFNGSFPYEHDQWDLSCRLRMGSHGLEHGRLTDPSMDVDRDAE